jgi:acetyl/propionyl-CoA carboxylase alpha subunit
MQLFEKYTAHLPGHDREVEVARGAEGFRVRLPEPAGRSETPAIREAGPGDTGGPTAGDPAAVDETLLTWEEIAGGRILVRLGGRPVECRITRLPDGAFRIEWRGRQVLVSVADDLAERARLAHAAHGGPVPLRSPMPGTVVRVLVAEGDIVTHEQPLLVIEAMKMQNELAAPVGGKVVNLAVKAGQAVEGDQVLLEIRG